MEERRIGFELFGQEFSFYSDAPEEEIEQVIALLQEEFKDQEQASRHGLHSATILIFGCLRMAARLVQERSRQQTLSVEQQRSIATMIDKLVSHLD